ncbi:hypothetical protein A2524_00025 [Candidatus Wolfebacteria bacterium RIFOXYD12_FULL_48_21]|uniref:Four helix bundle protein n=1 Tax=Candidatus Wolfebacteria bacterium RIFOXYD1_FULL_48_65 TaxID=1802561 RepID=A0A1F8E3R9_9BACT|nr:MAG: hypothetical protein A2524_00025 [Candidatus Wolfebacteria bacterium RIFOXYD12_FULL_48_21]OGM95476.1 MAG: hypothetical protein A2610_00910 [Candidatus Wolfebacteria bacterium RIFOXYD1_FULL_48_65]OGM95628.1 MAG: hypothetical protein A2532_04495 [Candidatus Wolfebacteria bacterium RIFOXYD2_FULL_48_11]
MHFTDLNAWKEGHKLVLAVYKVTKSFPKEELFGLVSQMRRCAVSITSNIAEGFGRQTFRDKANFYVISRGSVSELQNQLIIAKDVGLLDEEQFASIMDNSIKVHKIIVGLVRASNERA